MRVPTYTDFVVALIASKVYAYDSILYGKRVPSEYYQLATNTLRSDFPEFRSSKIHNNCPTELTGVLQPRCLLLLQPPFSRTVYPSSPMLLNRAVEHWT